MKKTNLLLAAAFSMALGSIAMNASACSTVVVGKDVSATGQIMMRASEILCPWDNRSPPNGCIQ